MTTSQQLADISAWVDDSYPSTLCQEAVLRRRIDKTAEEYGEVIDALGAAVGENPRKGVTGTMDEVRDELLDVACAALGAVEHMTGNTGQSIPLLEEKVRSVWLRALTHGMTLGRPV